MKEHIKLRANKRLQPTRCRARLTLGVRFLQYY